LRQAHLRQLRQRLTLRAKTYPLTLDETQAYVAQRLRIAGSNGRTIFDPEAVALVHRYASGIPRVINLLCEHALVSAFVDQQPTIFPVVVEAVARDFDMGDNSLINRKAEPALATGDKFDLLEALKTLSTLADRLKESEQDLPKERKI
jgi:hypothetical protein